MPAAWAGATSFGTIPGNLPGTPGTKQAEPALMRASRVKAPGTNRGHAGDKAGTVLYSEMKVINHSYFGVFFYPFFFRWLLLP